MVFDGPKRQLDRLLSGISLSRKNLTNCRSPFFARPIPISRSSSVSFSVSISLISVARLRDPGWRPGFPFSNGFPRGRIFSGLLIWRPANEGPRRQLNVGPTEMALKGRRRTKGMGMLSRCGTRAYLGASLHHNGPGNADARCHANEEGRQNVPASCNLIGADRHNVPRFRRRALVMERRLVQRNPAAPPNLSASLRFGQRTAPLAMPSKGKASEVKQVIGEAVPAPRAGHGFDHAAETGVHFASRLARVNHARAWPKQEPDVLAGSQLRSQSLRESLSKYI